MKVLITGLCGFIGHHVADVLLRETDWDLIGLDRIDATSTLHRLRYIENWEQHASRVKFVWHDLRAPINPLIDKQIGAVDVVLHLAASTHVDRSITDPMSFVLDNVVGTTNLLEWAAKRRDIRLLNYFNTDECFGPAPEGVLHKEGDPYNCSNPYSAAKAGGAEMARAFSNTFKLPVLRTNTMNVLGERQNAEKFVPKIISHVLKGDELTIHANADRTRAGTRFYIHARNVAHALKFLVEYTQPWFDRHGLFHMEANIVGEKEISNLELAQMVADIVGKPLRYKLVDFHTSRPGHDLRYALDGAKLASLGFIYPMPLEQSLERIVQWYLENPEWL